MRTRNFKLCVKALAIAGMPFLANQVLAAEVWLVAKPTTVTMPDGVVVPMWGYANCGGSFAGCDSATATVPGPALTVPAGDTTLKVHLRNDLLVPTSLVINGLIKPMAPVWDTTGVSGPRPSLAARVRSFDAEAAAATTPGTPGGVVDYTWTVKPGTYLYQSGTQPQVQVQMGLYGAMTRNALDPVIVTGTRAQAYAAVVGGNPVAEYDNQVTLIYSEIDPALHEAVGGLTPTYGTPGGPTSTLNYEPKYFLINGNPYPHISLQSIAPVGADGTTLLRMLNAGLTTRVPVLQEGAWDLVAEDGKAYNNRRSQYSALLAAAKTTDVLIAAPVLGAATKVGIMDRRLGLSNAGESNGGMLAFLNRAQVAATFTPTLGGPANNDPPAVFSDTYDSVKGMVLTVTSPGVLANDSDTDGPYPVKAITASGTTSGGGTYALNANGSFTYTPGPSFTTGADTFMYKATDGNMLSMDAMVTINVTSPALPSLGGPLDAFTRANANNLGAAWSQTVSTGPDGPNLQIVDNEANAFATDLGGQAIWNSAAAFGAKQGAALTFRGATPDNTALILKATGTVADKPANFIRVRYQSSNGGEVVVATMLGGSNTSTYVNQGTLPAVLSNGNTMSATVDDKGLVLVWGGSTFLGGVQLPKAAVWQGGGKIGIQLQTVDAGIDNFTGATLP